MSVLGIDVGTSSTKATLIDEAGRIVKSASTNYATHRQRTGEATIRPRDLLTAVEEVIRRCCREVPASPPLSLAFSVIGEAMVPLGAHGEPRDDIVLAMDYRGRDAYQAFVQAFGAQNLMDRTGHPIHPMYSLAKIVWWRQRFPKESHLYYDVQAFLLRALTGEGVTDFSQASRMQLLDIKRGTWSDVVLEKLNLSEDQLPRLQPAGSVAGTLSGSWADRLGLGRGTPVVVGGFDQACAALGAGVDSQNVAFDNTGTTLCIGLSLINPVVERSLLDKGYQWSRHVVPSATFLNGGSQAGGHVLQWFHELLRDEGKEDNSIGNRLKHIDERPSPVIVAPFFAGSGTPRLDASKAARIENLTFATTIDEIFAAALDAINFEARLILETAGEVVGKVEKIVVTGSPPRSVLWMQRKANTYGCPIIQPAVPEASGLGAARLAYLGHVGGASISLGNWDSEARTVAPQEEKVIMFQEAYERYCSVVDVLTAGGA